MVENQIAHLKRRRICDSTTSHAVETRALPICCAEDIAEVRSTVQVGPTGPEANLQPQLSIRGPRCGGDASAGGRPGDARDRAGAGGGGQGPGGAGRAVRRGRGGGDGGGGGQHARGGERRDPGGGGRAAAQRRPPRGAGNGSAYAVYTTFVRTDVSGRQGARLH